jgi:hypothetical protein
MSRENVNGTSFKKMTKISKENTLISLVYVEGIARKRKMTTSRSLEVVLAI